jgi:hypothetical protein
MGFFMKISFFAAVIFLLASCSKTNSTNENTGNNRLTDDPSLAQGVEYFLLSEKRNDITFPPMNTEERKIILDQARVVLGQLYVNRLKKIEDFGSQVDPLPQLDTFEAQYLIADINTFHEQMAKIFNSQRDYHTWYQNPAPFGCYNTVLPFSVAPAKSWGHWVSAVKSISQKAEVTKFAPELKQLSIGDILLSVDGTDTEVAMAKLKAFNQGANPPALLRGANRLLTYRSQNSLPLPKEDSVTLEFQKANLTRYTVTLPWITFATGECTSGKKALAGSAIKKDELAENRELNEYENFYKNPTKPSKTNFLKNIFSPRIDNNQLLGTLTDTTEPTIHWRIFSNLNGKFGVIRLDSFMPSQASADEAKKIISDLMSNQMASVDGIIFDLRNNGGGDILYGESLAELITGKSLEVLNFRLLNTPATQHYFKTVEPQSVFYKLILKAQETGAAMTSIGTFQQPDELYTEGQSFFKPVAIFTNSSCYSTCDMTSALFQDQGIAEIWAEDAQTGAGGANNWDLNEILGLLKTNTGPFHALPNGQNMGFAFRQVVRTGIHAGEILENNGVRADHVLETSVDDIISGGDSQFFKISASLAAKKNQYLASVNFNPSYVAETSSETLNLILDVKATDQIQIFNNKNKIQEINVVSSVDSQTITVPVPMNALAKNYGTLEIIGYSKGARVWRKISKVRKTPVPTKLAANEVLAPEFKSDLSPFVVYNFQSNETLGWHAEDGFLRLGESDGYKNSVNSTTALFLDTKNKSSLHLSFDLEAYSEENYDFFDVSLVVDGKTVPLTGQVSGKLQKSFDFDLSQYVGKKLELRFSFKSDTNTVDKGVWVSHLIIK